MSKEEHISNLEWQSLAYHGQKHYSFFDESLKESIRRVKERKDAKCPDQARNISLAVSKYYINHELPHRTPRFNLISPDNGVFVP
jgi:hypothetical protein